MKVTQMIHNAEERINEAGAKAMLCCANAAGKAMNTKVGRDTP